MKRNLLFGITVLLLIFVLGIVAPDVCAWYEQHRERVRDGQFDRLIQHIAEYQDAHDGVPPVDLEELARAHPIEPDLRTLIRSGRFEYVPPEDGAIFLTWSLTFGERTFMYLYNE